MATFDIQGSDLVLHLSLWEKVEAVHGDIRVPLSTVASVRAVSSAWPELRGIRAPGTGIPGVVAVGTRRGGFGKDFAVVHRQGPAVVVELDGAPYSRLVVTIDDAGATVATIDAVARRGRG